MAESAKTAPAQPVSFRGTAGTIHGDRWTPTGDVRGSLLLLHGGGQTRHSWRKSAPGLAALGWDVTALDARGHGESDWASDGDYRIDRFVDDLTAVIAQLADDSVSPRPPVVIGASMGGITGLVAEGENPGLLRALILVDIAPRIEPTGVQRISDFMGSAPDGFADLDEVAEAVSAYRGDASRPANIDSLRRNVRTGANGRLFWHWDPAFTTSDRNLGDHAAMHARTTAAASNVAIPTLLVWGAKSDIVDVQAVEELRTLIPHATTVTISDATHMVVGDDNDTFVAGTAAFLAGL
ncbi:alpha/beta fold hydrolase [Mycolicibacterium fluoranthenivorans]|uniref:Alpha/beta fold hydrolase n=1 Tax=Mycolicibacterium fluoranthenivorans TaxID=258505 RepID=A0A7G8PG86_9MYCO|nr:alpha/beta hydrolase [Mycolicibacterium fluoranthenivorans]QNJ93352.1 alpha/beta fold hydrolase [Mycolicibacterium fluoranthenivorans]